MTIISEKFDVSIKQKRKNNNNNETTNERKIKFKKCMTVSLENILYSTLIDDGDEKKINFEILFFLSRINNAKYTNVPNRKNKRLAIIHKGRWNRNNT